MYSSDSKKQKSTGFKVLIAVFTICFVITIPSYVGLSYLIADNSAWNYPSIIDRAVMERFNDNIFGALLSIYTPIGYLFMTIFHINGYHREPTAISPLPVIFLLRLLTLLLFIWAGKKWDASWIAKLVVVFLCLLEIMPILAGMFVALAFSGT